MPRRKISQREARAAIRRVEDLEQASYDYSVGTFAANNMSDNFRGRLHALRAIGCRLWARYTSDGNLEIVAMRPKQ